MKPFYGRYLLTQFICCFASLFFFSFNSLKSQDSTFQFTENPYYWSVEGECVSSDSGTVTELIPQNGNFPLNMPIIVRGNLNESDRDNYGFFVYDQDVKLDFNFYSTLDVYTINLERYALQMDSSGIIQGGYFNYFSRKYIGDVGASVNIPPGYYRLALHSEYSPSTCESSDYEFSMNFSGSDQPAFNDGVCAVLGEMYEPQDIDVYFSPIYIWMYPAEFDMDYTGIAGLADDLQVYFEMDIDTSNTYTIELISPLGTTATLVDSFCYGVAAIHGLFSDTAGTVPCAYNSYGNFQSADSLSVFSGEPLAGIWKFKVTYYGTSSKGPNYMVKKFCLVNEPPVNDCSIAHELIPKTTNAAGMHESNLSTALAGINQCTGSGNVLEKWFKFTANAENMFIHAQGYGDFDVVVELYDDCSSEVLICRNSSGAGAAEGFVLPGVVGEEYYYRIYNANPSGSNVNFQTAVAHIPFVKLRALDCGKMDFQVNSYIRSDQPSNSWLLSNYMFEFTELEPPYNTYEIVSPNGTNPNFLLSWLAQAENGRTYSVRVKTKQYEGPTWGSYGAACTIGISSELPLTGLDPAYANLTYDLCDILRALPVSGASNYKWHFMEGLDTVIYNSGSSSYFASLDIISGINLSKTYTVHVFATINGQTPTTGPVKTFYTTDTVPLTSVTAYCGQTLPLTSMIQTTRVCGAGAYMWKFSNTSQGQQDIYYYRTGNNSIYIHWVPGIIAGDSYDVSVYAEHASAITAGFGPVCNITIEGQSGMMAQSLLASQTIGNFGAEIQLLIYPNPSEGNEINIMLSNLPEETEAVNVRVYSALGKLINNEILQSTGAIFNRILTFNEELPAGMYFLTITDKNNTLITTEKIVVE